MGVHLNMTSNVTIDKTPTADLLCDAIRNRQRVMFSYHEKERVGEPQCCGISKAGKEVVRIYLLKGGSRPEQLFEVRTDRIIGTP